MAMLRPFVERGASEHDSAWRRGRRPRPFVERGASGCDSAWHEADDFRDKLVAQGVQVDYKNYPHAEHGFTHEDLREYRPDDATDAWERIARFIREH
jgi:acetyl esterase/lipase